MLIAAVDQGSSSTKGALIDETGAVRARAEVKVSVRRERASVTHDPEELLASVLRVLAELEKERRPDAVALACQRSTCLVWERESGRPLTPALSWQDLSAAERAKELEPYTLEITQRTGLRLSPYYAGSKLGMLLDEAAHLRRRAEGGEVVAGTLDTFLVHRLTGRPSTEPGHAGRTLLYALDDDRWDPALCDAFGVPAAALAELLPSADARGVLLPSAGRGLAGVPFLALLGDQQAALLGNGGAGGGGAGVGDGTGGGAGAAGPRALPPQRGTDGDRVAVVHFGTGAFALTATGEAPLRHPGLLAAVAWSRRGAAGAHERHFQLEGSVNSAGSAVEWALRLRDGAPAAAAASVGDALAALGAAELDPERLPDFLPGFVGVGAPWWHPHPGATFASLALTQGPDELVAAVLVGVVQRVVDCVHAFAAAGVGPALLRASGRLAALPAVAGLLADLSGLPVEVVAEEEAGLRGAARLAALALGASPATLTFTPPLRGRREPRWPEARRVRVRARWRAFVDAAAALPAPSALP
jgi:glycerol kinase